MRGCADALVEAGHDTAQGRADPRGIAVAVEAAPAAIALRPQGKARSAVMVRRGRLHGPGGGGAGATRRGRGFGAVGQHLAAVAQRRRRTGRAAVGELAQTAGQDLPREEAVIDQHRLLAGMDFAGKRSQGRAELACVQSVEAAERRGRGIAGVRDGPAVEEVVNGTPGSRLVGRQSGLPGHPRGQVQRHVGS